MLQHVGPFAYVSTVHYVVVGSGISICAIYSVFGVGIVASGVPFCESVGCDMGRVVFVMFVSSPHRIWWVRGLQCCGMLLWSGAA